MRIRVRFVWYDFWIGGYWDKGTKTLYLCFLPCLPIIISFGKSWKV